MASKGAYRTGGFGGVNGLADYLREEAIDFIVDATHPFAATISENAHLAAENCAIPIIHLWRDAWQAKQDDMWLEVESLTKAAEAIEANQSPVFLTTGRQTLKHFTHRTDIEFLARTIDEGPGESDPLPDNFTLIHAKGPFTLSDEIAIMQSHGIKLLISKNSGGAAARAKLDAARELGLPVMMIERPNLPQGTIASTPEEGLLWLNAQLEPA